MNVMQHVVHVESSYNPYAIGVVGGRLVRQPQNLPEALATVRMLQDRGYNFSVGLAQVNRYNLTKYGLGSYEEAFKACPNIQAGSRILAECYGRSGGDWGKAFSCYYSGDFATGYRHGYVQKVYASIQASRVQPTDAIAIPLVTVPVRSGTERNSLATAQALPATSSLVAARIASTNAASLAATRASPEVSPLSATAENPASMSAAPTAALASFSADAPVMLQPLYGRPDAHAPLMQIQKGSADTASVGATRMLDSAFVF